MLTDYIHVPVPIRTTTITPLTSDPSSVVGVVLQAVDHVTPSTSSINNIISDLTTEIAPAVEIKVRLLKANNKLIAKHI